MAIFSFSRRARRRSDAPAAQALAPSQLAARPSSRGQAEPISGFEPDWSEPDFEQAWSEPNFDQHWPTEAFEAGSTFESALESVRSRGGEALPGKIRDAMQPRIGRDLSGVRIHRDEIAGTLTDAVQARAFTVGRDLYFGNQEFDPGNEQGQRLIAHELAHAAQQTRAERPMVQRESETSGAKQEVTAQDVLPFAKGSTVILNQALGSLLAMVEEFQPDMASTLRALVDLKAEVSEASPDLVELKTGPISVPQGSTTSHFESSMVRIQRRPNGRFEFSISGSEGANKPVTPLFSRGGLSASRQDARVILSDASGPTLFVEPAGKGSLNVGAFTAPFTKNLPAIARALVPETVTVLNISALPAAQSADAAAEQSVESVAKAGGPAKPKRKRQEVSVSGGLVTGTEPSPAAVLGTAWQLSLNPISKLPFGLPKELLEMPLRVHLEYVPNASVLGGISVGGGLDPSQIEALKLPVNLRINVGAAGGALEIGAPESKPIFGPTVGGSVGVALGPTFRLNLSAEALFNLVNRSEGAGTLFRVTAGVGARF